MYDGKDDYFVSIFVHAIHDDVGWLDKFVCSGHVSRPTGASHAGRRQISYLSLNSEDHSLRGTRTVLSNPRKYVVELLSCGRLGT